MPFEHLDRVLAETTQLALAFSAAGFELYLVGGIVRDQYLDRPLDSESDLDLTTNARPEEIKAIVEPFAKTIWTQGERFGTIGVQLGERLVEITTYRKEVYDPKSRKPAVSFGEDVTIDLSRRDFSVNAMAIDAVTGELLDPWQGAKDLATNTLRTPLKAEISFNDDPLRMLRAARFSTKYRLVAVPELVEAAKQLSHRLGIVAIERIGEEIRRLLALEKPSQGVRFLAETGLLAEVLFYGEDCPTKSASTQGLVFLEPNNLAGLTTSESRVGRVAESVDGLHTMIQRLAALLIEVFSAHQSPLVAYDTSTAKKEASTATSRPEVQPGISAQTPEHSEGASGQTQCSQSQRARNEAIFAQVDACVSRLRLSNVESKAVRSCVGAVLDLEYRISSESVDAPFLRAMSQRLASSVEHEMLSYENVFELVCKRCSSQPLLAKLKKARALFKELEQTEGLPPSLPELSGSDIMELFNLESGPAIGLAVKYLKQQRLEYGPLEKNHEIAILKEWFEAKN